MAQVLLPLGCGSLAHTGTLLPLVHARHAGHAATQPLLLLLVLAALVRIAASHAPAALGVLASMALQGATVVVARVVARAVAATRQDVVVRDTLAMLVLHRLDVAEVLILAVVASQAVSLLALSP